MTAILTPALALRHLHELSTDLRAAVALAPGGGPLAGDAAIDAPARAVLGAMGDQDAATATISGATVVAVRAPTVAFVVVAGPHALVALLEHDLRTLLSDVREGPGDAAGQAVGDGERATPEAGSNGFGPFPAGAGPALEALISAADAVFAG